MGFLSNAFDSLASFSTFGLLGGDSSTSGSLESIGKAVEKPFRTGATQAGKEAISAGETQLGEQQALGSEIKGLYQPQIQAGQKAFTGLTDYYGGNQQPIIDQAKASPFYESMTSAGADEIAKYQQATGGFRSGTTQENLVENRQNVLQGLINQQLQGQSNIYNAGAGAQDAYSVAMQNILAGQGATRGEIAGIGINQAANKQNMLTGLLGGAASAIIPSAINKWG